MSVRDKDKPALAKALIYLSVVAVVLAVVGATGNDLYLASTQWLLIGVLLGVWAVYFLLEANYRLHS